MIVSNTGNYTTKLYLVSNHMYMQYRKYTVMLFSKKPSFQTTNNMTSKLSAENTAF